MKEFDIEATAKYPENIAKIIQQEVTTLNNRFSKQPSIGRCHLGLS